LQPRRFPCPVPETWLTFEPLTLIPELQMLVQVFPFDPFLPNLPRVMDGLWPELETRLLKRFGAGRWEREQQSVEPLRYLMADSAVARYTLTARDAESARTQTKRFYAKIYRKRYG